VDKLKQLKCLVIDEADFFFTDANVLADMENLFKDIIKNVPNEIQYVLFSATYKGDVNTRISEFVTKAY
jgi:superfamily II DNA/RNA helicase